MTCVETIETDKGRSPSNEVASAGSATKVAAATIDPAAQTVVKVTEGYRIDGQPILYATADKTALVVDARWFSELTVADPTRMAAGESVTVGKLGGKMAGRELLKFLLAAEIIRSYWHTNATLCVERERDDGGGGGYQATVSGVHTYYTNERVDKSFGFTFSLAPDGTISVAR